MNKTSVFLILLILAIFIPSLLVLDYALQAGPLPDNDYWGSVGDIVTDDGFSTHLGDWLNFNNEHIVTIPKIIFAINLVLTGGSNVGLSLTAWLAGLLQVILLSLLLQHDRMKRRHIIILSFIIAAFVFNPRNAHNWFMGMSGVTWITENLMAIACIFSLHRLAVTQQKCWLIWVITTLLLAILTYSTALSLIPTIIIGGYLLNLPKHQLTAISILGAILFLTYIANYERPTYHPELQTSLWSLASYFFVFIGNLVTHKGVTALFYGLLITLFSLTLAIYLYKQKKDMWHELMPWFLIQIYVMGNAAMASLARSGFGLEQALSSRYSSLSALFWLAFCVQIYKISYLFTKRPTSVFFPAFAILLTGFIIYYSHFTSRKAIGKFIERSHNKMLAAASLYSQAYDIQLLKENVNLAFQNHHELDLITHYLKKHGYIPFTRTFEDCPATGEKIKPHKLQIQPTEPFSIGTLDQIKFKNDPAVSSPILEVSGWAYEENQKIWCIAITNEKNIVKGIAIMGLKRQSPIANLKDENTSLQSGWQGYSKLDDSAKIQAFALVGSPPQWQLLNGSYQLIQ